MGVKLHESLADDPRWIEAAQLVESEMIRKWSITIARAEPDQIAAMRDGNWLADADHRMETLAVFVKPGDLNDDRALAEFCIGILAITGQ